jgi:cytochrome b subunit of formate dehydrogenase
VLARALFAFMALLAISPAASFAVTNDECLECHSDPSIQKEGEGGKTLSLYVPATEFGSSVHAAFNCVDCHTDYNPDSHPGPLGKVDCGTCHADAMAAYATSIHGQAVAKGIADAPTCSDCHGTHGITSPSNPASNANPLRIVGTCARCHASPEIVRKYDMSAEAPIDAYLKSVHGRALMIEGNADAPNCSTCHPAHTMLPARDPASTVARANIPGTCGQCHGDIVAIYSESIHGVAAARGVTDSPVCTDCHGEHSIQEPTNPASSVFPANIAKTTCTRCHSSQILSGRYGFDATRIETYRETYHGLASKKGALNVANCASCHGVHNIFPSADPRSTVNRASLQKTCGTCHPNASVEFASIQVHPTISGPGSPVQTVKRPRDVAKSIYIMLLLVVIGGMAVHNIIIWIHQVIEKRRRELKKPRVRRFERFEAIEHVILLVSFFTLVFTGFALKFADSSWVRLTEQIGMTEAVRGIVHRVAAVVMIGISLVHLGFLLLTRPGRRELAALRPTMRDVTDFVHNMAYNLRLRTDRPTFPHFDYTEKAEYLALIWGTIVMVFTGFVLWFPTYFTRILPGWIFEVSEVVHYYEAWLAFLAIVVWHFFYVLFGPEASPMSVTWMDGMTTVDHALHKHGSLQPHQEIQYPEGDEPPATGKRPSA